MTVFVVVLVRPTAPARLALIEPLRTSKSLVPVSVPAPLPVTLPSVRISWSIVSVNVPSTSVAPPVTFTSASSLMLVESLSVNVPPPSVIVPVPAFSPPAAMVTLPSSTRLIPPLPLVVTVTVVAASRRKFVVEPMPPDPAFKIMSSAVMSVPVLSPVVIAPLPLVVSDTSPFCASKLNVPNSMLLPEPAVKWIAVVDAAPRSIFAENVIPPVFASPMTIVPAVIRSSSVSVKLSDPPVSDPRSIARVAVC